MNKINKTNKLQAQRFKEITPNDSENIFLSREPEDIVGVECRIYIGTGGNVKVENLHGDIATYKNVNDGQFLPIDVIKVYSTDTTAEDIVALW